jgi:aspartyl aminopeptidase
MFVVVRGTQPAMTSRVVIVGTAVLMGLCAGHASADEPPIGHQPTAWERKAFAPHRKAAMTFGDEYRAFIDRHRTEREVVAAALALARQRGHKDLFSAKRPRLGAGARVYAQVHGKLIAFAILGKKPIAEGVHIVATHIDAVRIDLKQNPLYADGNLALLETHYYGGIKKYQWLSQPLELRGVVITKAGKRIDVSIGSKPTDPVFVIPDVAVHVAGAVDRIEGEQVQGESLDPIVSSTPADTRAPGIDPFAAQTARLLSQQLGIELADLTSAELELVPAAPARDVGLDRAIVGGYGQDDRACSYAALRALLAASTPQHTAIVFFTDKEEIGSSGNTGARSQFVRRVIAELIESTGSTPSELAVDRAMANSIVFSADTTGAVNPAYRELYERKNASFLGSGVVWDQTAVHAEVMAYVRGLFDRNGITHQPSTWTKTTGSKSEHGTVLPYFTRHGMDGLNVSIPLLSMHAPFELVSKADLYEGYRAYKAFLED